MPVSFWTSWPDNEINKMKKKTKNDETKKEGQQKFKIIIEENDFYFVLKYVRYFCQHHYYIQKVFIYIYI
jgi:hypothetical protein